MTLGVISFDATLNLPLKLYPLFCILFCYVALLV